MPVGTVKIDDPQGTLTTSFKADKSHPELVNVSYSITILDDYSFKVPVSNPFGTTDPDVVNWKN